jgi:hypothetical protein
MTRGVVTVDKEYGVPTVDLNNIGYKDKPFVLAADVNQVFYVKDMSTKIMLQNLCERRTKTVVFVIIRKEKNLCYKIL